LRHRIAGTGVSHGGSVGIGLGVGSTDIQKHTSGVPGVTVVRSQVMGMAAAVAVACPARSVASAGTSVGVGSLVGVTSMTSRMTGVDVGANGSGVGLGDGVSVGNGLANEVLAAGAVGGKALGCRGISCVSK